MNGLSETAKNRIIELYKTGATTMQIARAIPCGKSTANSMWKEYLLKHPEDTEAQKIASVKMKRALAGNQPAASVISPRPVRHCTACGAEVNQKSAKFCWQCGADVRDRHLILLEKVRRSVHSRVNLLPNNLRDEFNGVVLEIEDLLMKEAES